MKELQNFFRFMEYMKEDEFKELYAEIYKIEAINKGVIHIFWNFKYLHIKTDK